MTRGARGADEGDDSRWDAVSRRDRDADGRFVYGVRSTGIYCRPSCPSRRPRRDRVRFFATSADAARAGFRACRRCRPDTARPPDPWLAKVQLACALLERANTSPPLATLARLVGAGPFQLQRHFSRIVGVTPRAYADSLRLRRLRDGSSSRFYERAAPLMGMHASTYRRGGMGMTVAYAAGDSRLGRVLVAATPRGVCAVFMGRTDAELARALAREFPAASINAAASPTLAKWLRQVVTHLEGRGPELALPLDVRATAFQWQVWTALAAIPRGETRTYADIARSIGRPRAARAVGRACATNAVAVAIPCHRAVPAAGGLGGYRWGIARKQALLDLEHAPFQKSNSIPMVNRGETRQPLPSNTVKPSRRPLKLDVAVP